MKTYVATKNAGKLAEMEAIFAGSALELLTYRGYRDVSEGETSYMVNALLKARALTEQLRAVGLVAAVIADDSGIEVDALGGRPGVLSARYAGADASWDDRLQLMLHDLQAVPHEQRGARFVCVMALVLPDGDALTATGIVEGRIALEEHGAGGFGYDPIFYHESSACTFAQLGAETKNAVSHRRRAADALLALLGQRD